MHDRAHIKDGSNLSIEYIIKNCAFDKDRKDNLSKIQAKLNEFYSHIKKYRNKMLAHNDRDVALLHQVLGGFSKGEDVAYFDNLQEFINVTSEGFSNGPMPFYTKISVEAQEFFQVLVEGFKKLYNGKLGDIGKIGELNSGENLR